MVFSKKQARFQDINEIKEDFYFVSIRQNVRHFFKEQGSIICKSTIITCGRYFTVVWPAEKQTAIKSFLVIENEKKLCYNKFNKDC